MQPVSSMVSNVPSSGGIAGLDRDGLSEPGGALQPEFSDVAKAPRRRPRCRGTPPSYPTGRRTSPPRRPGRPMPRARSPASACPPVQQRRWCRCRPRRPGDCRPRPPLPAGCPRAFFRPARTSLGHFSENFISSDPADLSDASMLTLCSAASSASPAANPSVAATAGETSITSRTLLARLPRGAIQGRCRRPRPAVCSDVTNHIGPRSPSRARAIASALVEPI